MNSGERFDKFAEGRELGSAAGFCLLAFLSVAGSVFAAKWHPSLVEEQRVEIVKNDIILQYGLSLGSPHVNTLDAAVLENITDRIEAGEKGLVSVPAIMADISNVEIDMGHAHAVGERYFKSNKAYEPALLGIFGLAAVISVLGTAHFLRRKEDDGLEIIEESLAL